MHTHYCNTLSLKLYNDANSDCIKESTENYNYFPVLFEVDSNGIAMDTISVTSGVDYTAYGNPGDIYSFRIIHLPGGLYASCPVSGVITDTLESVPSVFGAKSIALSCNPGSSFDLAAYIGIECGKHQYEGDIIVSNAYCTPQSGTVTAEISPKYVYLTASPAPSSVSGNTLTWNVSNVSATAPQPHIHFICGVPGAWLLPGDTASSTFSVSPTAGDADPTNNLCIRTDTVISSYDPNEMAVTPQGTIPSGTQLQYTIQFENTGNDTAQNIYIMDTLSV